MQLWSLAHVSAHMSTHASAHRCLYTCLCAGVDTCKTTSWTTGSSVLCQSANAQLTGGAKRNVLLTVSATIGTRFKLLTFDAPSVSRSWRHKRPAAARWSVARMLRRHRISWAPLPISSPRPVHQSRSRASTLATLARHRQRSLVIRSSCASCTRNHAWTHSWTHTLTRSLTHSPTHSLTHSLAHPLTHSRM